MYTCPVCAYPKLPEPPRNFSICPSCGTEFGYDDAKVSHTELRHRWIAANAPWFSTARHPSPGWNPWVQLIEGHYEGEVPFLARFQAQRLDVIRAKAIIAPQVVYTVQFT